MFHLTRQERQAFVFLSALGLLGLGIDFTCKLYARPAQSLVEESGLAKVDLNKAGFRELVDMAGVSPFLAKRIIEYRDAHGPFRSLEELKEVKGIGEYRYEKLKGLFVTE